LSVRILPAKRQALAIDLKLEFLREGGKLRMVFSYSRKLYQDEVIANMMEQLTDIVIKFSNADKQTPLCDVMELPKAQQKQILEDFAGKCSDENPGKTLVDLFREQSIKTPDNRAIVFKDKSITYAELNEVTDKISAYLTLQNKGTAVGILVNRSEMMPVGALGVMKSGAAYLPLDPGYPTERLEFMLEDAGVSTVIIDEELKDRIPGYSGNFLLTKDIAKLPGGDVPVQPEPEDTMVLLYTSGTTGKPKGVILSHGNLINFCTWYRNCHNITENDNIPAYASFGFDAHMMDMYPTLISGACLHIIPEEMRLDLPGLRDYFSRNNINVAFITTQLGRQFAEKMSSRGLRALSVGGETLVPLAPPESYTLYNAYGPTECTVFATNFRIDKLYDRVPIGSALDNTALYVVDKQNGLSPVGVAGELCIAGRQVGKGYLNRPDITEEKFVKNPFCSDPDYATMYRTGDIVRFLPDGNIDFVGRNDFQVKIRGFRVELTEIEERIRAFPGLRDAAVIAADAPGGGKCAIAYIAGNTSIDIEKLNAFIEEELPSYMVPSATMQLDKIPLNQNGKVDRRKLPAPTFTGQKAEDTVRPLNDLETQISETVSAILGHNQFGITTNLLRAGLTSLSSIKLAAALDEKFGVSVPVRDIMQNPTLLGIENAVIRMLLSGKTSQGTWQTEKQAKYPLSQNQMGIYYECIKNPGSTIYNIPLHVVFDRNTDAGRLEKAVSEIADAHPALRAALFMRENEIWQSYTDRWLHKTEIVSADEEEMPLIISAFVRPFNLFDSPLFRTKICRTEKNLHLLLDFHHIVFDGLSADIFMRELTRAYKGKVLEKEGFTSFDEALMEKEKENSEEYREAKAFYDRMMKNSEGATVIPYDYRENEKSCPTETVVSTVEKESVARC
jgi:amino acid adenylation domain-containing protein